MIELRKENIEYFFHGIWASDSALMKADSMYAIVKEAFPNASIVIDAFHIVKRFCDGLDEMRMHFKRKAVTETKKEERAFYKKKANRAKARAYYRKKHPKKSQVAIRTATQTQRGIFSSLPIPLYTQEQENNQNTSQQKTKRMIQGGILKRYQRNNLCQRLY